MGIDDYDDPCVNAVPYIDPIITRLWNLAQQHTTDAVVAEHEGNAGLATYHEGKAFAYEHAARMLEGTDAS